MGRRALPEAVLGFRLTPRDRQIVRAVYEHRAVTTPHVQALLFSPAARRPDTRCKRRLQLLYQAGYLFRDEQPTKLSEGRKPLVYFLAERGAHLVAELLGISRRQVDWSARDNDVKWPFLAHLLATNDVRIAVTTAAQRHGWEVLRWVDDASLRRAEMKDYVTLTGPGSAAQRVAVVPDGYFALRVETRTYHRFLETDLGTVTARASTLGRRDWARKVRAYVEYYRSGAYLRRYGAQGVRVLTVTTSEQRLETLKQVTTAVGGRQLFLFTTFARLRGADPLIDPIWQSPARDGLHPLITSTQAVRTA